MNRRSLLRASALVVPAALVAGCTTSTVNGVTTVTLNVAQVTNWGTAFLNCAKFVAGFSGLPAATVTLIDGVISTTEADLTTFETTTSGVVELKFDSTSVPAAVSSLLADGKTLVADLSAIAMDKTASYFSAATNYLNAAETILTLFEAALGSVSAKVSLAVGATPMTEAQALATFGVK